MHFFHLGMTCGLLFYVPLLCSNFVYHVYLWMLSFLFLWSSISLLRAREFVLGSIELVVSCAFILNHMCN